MPQGSDTGETLERLESFSASQQSKAIKSLRAMFILTCEMPTVWSSFFREAQAIAPSVEPHAD